MLKPSTRLNAAIFLISVCVCAQSAPAKPGDAKSERVVKAMVTDREDQPIEGASVVKIDWFSLEETVAPQELTNAAGEFEFVVSENDSANSNYVVIFKEGYAISALNLDALPARARLWKKKPVALRIVDAKQNPVNGARVTLGEVGFEDEFLMANVPAALGKLTGVTSRADGWAILLLVDSKGQWRGSDSVVANGGDHAIATLQVESSIEQRGTEYDCQVVEETSGEGVSGAEVSFQQPKPPYKSVKATSRNEGSLKAKLVPGTWRVSITKAPDGYCNVLHSAPQIVVPERGKRTLPTVKIPKGKTIEGTIRGVDLAIRRTRWIHVSWSRGDGESDQVYGWYKPDGTFRVAIPEDAIADTFEIVRVGGGGSDELVIESKDPLVLTSLAE